ncbi:hypothetical protein [Nocardia xishanensis]
MLTTTVLDLIVRLLWMPTAAVVVLGESAALIHTAVTERRNRMSENVIVTKPLPAIDPSNQLAVYVDAGHRRDAQLDADARRVAELHEESERLYPYGPPPRGVDSEAWDNITESVYLGQFGLGLSLHHWQVRNLAAFLADRLFVSVVGER